MDARLSARDAAIENADHYRPDIDGIRAVAIAGVLAFHLAPQALSGGFVGVDVFFVVSGYLITGIIFRKIRQSSFRISDFYARRARRLVPALVPVLAVTWCLGWLFFLTDEFQYLGKEVLAGAGFTSNLVLWNDSIGYFDLRKPLMHLWSLGVEEQFYLVWPLFLWAVWRTNKKLIPLSIAMVSVVSFSLMIWSCRADLAAAFYLPWNRLWELSLGAALAIAHTTSSNGRTRWRAFEQRLPGPQTRASLGLIMIVGAYVGLDENLEFPGWWALIPTLGALLLISAGPESAVGRKLLSARPIVGIGLISYPLYLWHWPLLALAQTIWGRDLSVVTAALVGSVSIALATLTYRYVEVPIRTGRAGTLLATTRGAMMVACGALVACALLGAVTASQAIPARAQSYFDVDRIVRALQEDWVPAGTVLPGARYHEQGTWTLSVTGITHLGRGPARVLFMGDSNMQQYYPRVHKLISERPHESRSVAFAAAAGCGPIVVDMLPSSFEDMVRSCKELFRDAIEYAKQPSIDTVVLTASWHWYLVTLGLEKSRSIDPVLEDLQKLVLQLTENGKRVVIVLNIPHSAAFDARQRIKRNLFAPAFLIDGKPVPKSTLIKVLELSGNKLRQVAAAGGATVIDPAEFLCEETSCPVLTVAGTPVYKNPAHLQPSFVRDNVTFLDSLVLIPEPMSSSSDLRSPSLR